MNWLLDSLAAIGRGAIAACRVTGSLTVFAAIGLSHLVRPPFYGRLFARARLEKEEVNILRGILARIEERVQSGWKK